MRSLFPSFISLFVIVLIVLARRPADMLRRRGAVSPETALPLDDLDDRDRRRLERLMAEGVVREASPGRFYFDRAAERARLRQRMPWLLGAIVLAVALGIAMAYFGREVTPAP